VRTTSRERPDTHSDEPIVFGALSPNVYTYGTCLTKLPGPSTSSTISAAFSAMSPALGETSWCATDLSPLRRDAANRMFASLPEALARLIMTE
jgi:hypothetical protein